MCSLSVIFSNIYFIAIFSSKFNWIIFNLNRCIFLDIFPWNFLFGYMLCLRYSQHTLLEAYLSTLHLLFLNSLCFFDKYILVIFLMNVPLWHVVLKHLAAQRIWQLGLNILQMKLLDLIICTNRTDSCFLASFYFLIK